MAKHSGESSSRFLRGSIVYLMQYLQVFPSHPLPKPKELIGSYLCRISKNNLISDIPTLRDLLFPDVHIRNLRNFNEFKPGKLREFYQSMNITPNDIPYSLWFVGANFGRSDTPQVTSRFIGSLISCIRKFCPKCLMENGFLQLIWKFNNVNICLNHIMYLNNKCLNCRNEIPNLPKNLSNNHCPFCDADLRKQIQDQYPLQNEIDFEKENQKNLSFLLKKQKSNLRASISILLQK